MLRTIWIWLLEHLWSEWQQVGTFQTEVDIQVNYYSKEPAKAWIHCYESRWGSRREEIKIQWAGWFHRKYHKKIRRAPLYQTEVYPWLHGRHNTKIPSFVLVKTKKWDFKKALLGETPVVLNDDESDVAKK